jgi:uncharacterized protein
MRINAARTVGGRAPSEVVLPCLRAIAIATLAVLFSSGTLRAAGGSELPIYIDSLPENRPLEIHVLGDSFAAELADGLTWSFSSNRRIAIKKHTKAATGLVRTDHFDWLKEVRKLLSTETVDVAIIGIGGNDRQDLRVDGKRYKRFSIGWRMEYMKRLEQLAQMLRKSGARVYWVGLPVVRSKRMTKDYARFNRYFESVAKAHDMKFIPIHHLFQSKDGGYTAYGESLRGNTVRLRNKDGIHLTIAGAKKLGRYVAGHIRRDMPKRGG